jgi:hypothetical protein
LRTEDTGDAIRQPTQYRNDNEADNHCDDVAKIVAAAFGKNSAEKDPEQRAICVTEIPSAIGMIRTLGCTI